VDVSNVEEADRGATNTGNIRQVIEKGMREGEEEGGWRCVAVTRDPRNSARIRITCRDESELARVKEVVAEKTKAVGSRVLRDQWYPIKVDNACRIAVLDENGEVRAGVTEMLEKENDVKIAKLSWLSRKDSPKVYGSMIVYVTKRADAARLLEGHYFDVDGESASVSATSIYVCSLADSGIIAELTTFRRVIPTLTLLHHRPLFTLQFINRSGLSSID
jgi:hypothetical protein